MIRLILFIFLFCAAGFNGESQKFKDSTRDNYSLHKIISTFKFEPGQNTVFSNGIIESKTFGSNQFSVIKKILFSEFQYSQGPKNNCYFITDTNLFFLIRKDIFFLSVLRI